MIVPTQKASVIAFVSNDITGGKNSRISVEMKKSNSKFNAYLDTLDSDDKTLSIHFSGYGYPNGIEAEPETIEDTFIFDIENASKEKLPKLI